MGQFLRMGLGQQFFVYGAGMLLLSSAVLVIVQRLVLGLPEEFLLWHLLYVAGFLILMLGPLGWFLYHTLLRPIARMIDANRRVAAGDEAGRTISQEAIPNNEIGELMRSRDEMLDSLRQMKEEHRTILQAAMDGLWIADLQGRLLDVNDAYCRMVGHSRAELLTMRIQDLEASESPEEMARHIRRVVEMRQDRFETRHRHKDGHAVDVEVSVQYLDLAGGRFIAFLRDITRRRRAREELQRRMADLERFNRLAVGRELRMKELKERIRELEAEREAHP